MSDSDYLVFAGNGEIVIDETPEPESVPVTVVVAGTEAEPCLNQAA